MKNLQIIFVVAIIILVLTACGSSSNNVPSLAPTPTTETADEVLNNEAMMIAFTVCLREQGMDVADPVVDADGNIGKPEIPEGINKKEFSEAWEACNYLLEGFTFEGKREDLSEDLEYYLELAACMREEGININDPTAETLDTWMGDFKTTANFDDPDTMTALETCIDGEFGDGGGKGK